MSKVFVTQENQLFDYSALDQFGEVKFVTLYDFSTSATSLYNLDLMFRIKSAMSNYNPDEDYLVPSGSPLITAACMAHLVRRGVNRVEVLRWSNRDRTYQKVIMDFDTKENASV